MAPGMVPSATNDDPHFRHVRTAQGLSRLGARQRYRGVEQSPRVDFSCNVLCIYLSNVLTAETKTNFLYLHTMMIMMDLRERRLDIVGTAEGQGR